MQKRNRKVAAAGVDGAVQIGVRHRSGSTAVGGDGGGGLASGPGSSVTAREFGRASMPHRFSQLGDSALEVRPRLRLRRSDST
jgi:hypothetical protein